MDDEHFSAITVFVEVARRASFSAAARALAITPATASRKIGRLETRMGTRLLFRTTRQVALTEAGAAYFKRCAPVLDEIEEADLDTAKLNDEPRGILRVQAPVSFSRLHLTALFPEFLSRFPYVRLDVELTDRVVDLIEERIDVAIRVGELRDSRLVARRLMPNRRVVCAAPAYLERRGTPATPEELEDHDCLCASYFTTGNLWRLDGPREKRVSVRASGRLQANNVELLLAAAVAGHGIALIDTFAAQRALTEKRLIPILPEWTSQGGEIHVVYPSAEHLPPKVRALLDFLIASFSSTASQYK